MKAVLCKQNGLPESLELTEVPSPDPGSKELLIDIHSAAINFPDVLMIQGKYQSQPDFPFAPGGEIAGTIAAKGADVGDEFTIGQRVFAGIGHGGFAEQVAIPAKAAKPMPEQMPFDEAAAIGTTYGTSYYALKQRANLQPGETLLVLGAGGGVGLAAVELGKAMGARVIAAASSQEKLDAAAASGADELINYSDGELKDKVKALTNNQGADVIYDPVGGDLFNQCMRCINWYGRVLVIGFAAGDIPKLPINLVLLKSCQVVGVFYGAFSAKFPQDSAQNFAEIMEMYNQGKVKPLVGASFPLTDYAPALRALMERQAIGKVVVSVR